MRPSDAVDKGLHLPFDRLYMRVTGLDADATTCQATAEQAIILSRSRCPRLSGVAAGRLQPIWGHDYFGIRWLDNYVWFQEMGTRPFTMTKLQGKTVPMWVDDPDGKMRSKNPRIKTRRREDGRTQVLIFRKAAHKGERKTVKRVIGGVEQEVDVPRSYPGAPGRINMRRPGAPLSKMGGGQIMRGNVGVRWRHPGLTSRFFIHDSLLASCVAMGLPRTEILVAVQGERI